MESPAVVSEPQRRGPKPKFTPEERKARKAATHKLWYEKNREALIQGAKDKYYAARDEHKAKSLSRYYKHKEAALTYKQLLVNNTIPVPII